MKIWVISDTHFGHVSLATKYNARPDDFEAKIIYNWNTLIDPTDIVLHLGDLFIGNQSVWKDIVNNLNGNKVLIKGNHDSQSYSWYLNNGFSFACETCVWDMFGYTILFSHKPKTEGDFDINVHGHLHEGRHRELQTDHRHILISLEKNGYQPMLLETIIKKWEKSQARVPD